MFCVADSAVSAISPDLTVEASSLGLAPGEWPEAIQIPFAARTLTFERSGGRRDPEGDLMSVAYRTRNGHILTIWND